jgi:acetyl esterase/lipase
MRLKIERNAGRTCIVTALLCLCVFVKAQNSPQPGYALRENVSYIADSETDSYRQKRCKLDVYYPRETKGFATVVWFHGGALEGGQKEIPARLKNSGIAVVGVSYRLSPEAKNPAYTLDAAEAIAWVFKNIGAYGGDTARIFVGGHSAGGYLALLVGLEKKYLAAHGVDADRIRGLIPVSGKTNTHQTICKERGLSPDIPDIDEFAPISRVHKGSPPTLLVTGDRQLEMLGRFEENLHLAAIMRSAGNEVELYELQGFDHGTCLSPACELLLRFVNKLSK